MDPAIQNIILGVVANGFTALISSLGHRGQALLVGEKTITEIESQETALRSILQKSVNAVADNIEWRGASSTEEVRSFLTSPEAEAIVRQIYAASLSDDGDRSSLELIRREFLTSFSLYTGLNKDELEKSSDLLFDILLRICEDFLTVAVDEGVLSAHEAKSAFRYRIVLDELATIQENLAFLTGLHKPNIPEILEFEKKYRQQVINRHQSIIPPYFHGHEARKVPLDNIYVSPSFIATQRQQEENRQEFNLSDFLSTIYRAVLLGDPGSGKSTLAFKLCHDLASRYSERVLGGRRITPILVILRDYGAEKKARSCSILQYIEATANSKYQVRPPSNAFKYLLLNGRAAVIFDGLDELLDTSYREEISGDIEAFCNLYPSVPVLVTSRRVGYEQAPLDKKRFEVFRLSTFDDDQVKEYVTKWFAADADLTRKQQTQKAEAFLEESRVVPDLRSNPLMLALMCNIYRGENYIPRNRPDVYKKCSTMLFERWDKRRGIHVPLPFEAHIRPSMMYLAQWIYADEALQGGVTERGLVNKATEYLCPRRFEDRDEAEKAAREFIEYCRGRAWVFTDIGTTKEGERLYQFTHRTFLEYFTASYLTRIHPTPDRLGKALLPKIAQREWDVVAQLAFQQQSRNVEGAADDLLSTLLKQTRGPESDERWNLLSFAARCLEFMVPSPKVVRDITGACIEHCLVSVSKEIRQAQLPERAPRVGRPDDPAAGELLGDLLVSPSTETRATVADSVETLLVDRINTGSDIESAAAAEISHSLQVALFHSQKGAQQDIRAFWADVSDRILDACSDERLEEVRQMHFVTSLAVFWRRRESLARFVERNGVEALFRSDWSTVLPSMRWWSPAEWILNYTRDRYSRTEEEEANTQLRFLDMAGETGRILLASPPPWLSESGLPDYHYTSLLTEVEHDVPVELSSLDPDATFGVFGLTAVQVEMQEQHKEFSELIASVKENRIPLPHSLRWIFLARYEQVEIEMVQAQMEQCGFTASQKDLIWQWIRKEVNFVLQESSEDNRKTDVDTGEKVAEM